MENNLADKGAEFLRSTAEAAESTSNVDASEYDGDVNNIGNDEKDVADEVQDPDTDEAEVVEDEADDSPDVPDEDEAGDEGEVVEEADEEEAGDEEDELQVTDDSELEFADHPRFVELQEAEQSLLGLQSAIEAVQYPFESREPEKVQAELALRLGDADCLYAILDGKPLLDALFTVAAKKNGGAEVLKSVILQFDAIREKYAEQIGLEPVNRDDDDELTNADPALKQIKELKLKIAALEKGTGSANVNADNSEKDKVYKTFSERVGKLAKKYGYDEADAKEFESEIGTTIGKSPLGAAIRARIAQGKFVDVDKLFILRHNVIEARVAKRSKGKIATAKINSKKFSKQPNSGRKPAAEQARKPMTSEDRVAAGTRFLKNQK